MVPGGGTDESQGAGLGSQEGTAGAGVYTLWPGTPGTLGSVGSWGNVCRLLCGSAKGEGGFKPVKPDPTAAFGVERAGVELANVPPARDESKGDCAAVV